MTINVQLAAAGISLLVAGAFGLAFTGRVFRRQDDSRDRFFVTCLTAVALVYAFSGGVFWIGKSVADLPGPAVVIAGAVAVALAVGGSLAAWKLVGPGAAAAPARAGNR